MKKNRLALLLSSMLLVPAAAFAADEKPGFYVGGGYTRTELDTNGVAADAELGALFVRGGYQVNKNFAAEVRIGTGIGDDKIDGVKIEEDYTYGAYFKVGAPTSVGLYPYFLLGWTESKFKFSAAGSGTDKSGGLSYGAGLEYRFSQFSVGLEYAKFYNDDDYKINGLSLSANYKF